MSSGELWSGLGTALFMAIVGYVFNRTKEQELKHLSAALQQSLEQQGQGQARLLATIEKLAEALQPSVQQSVAPIEQSVARIHIGPTHQPEEGITLDAQTKAAALASKHHRFTESRTFEIVISELDMLTGSCKVAILPDTENRITATITDPVITQSGNAYVTAMCHLAPLQVKAKAEIDKEDSLVKLYISDLAGD